MRNEWKRWFCGGLTALFLFSISPCQALGVSTSAQSAILMDADSGRVLYAQNADQKMLIASTTKLLTALVAIEEGELNRNVKVSQTAAGTEGSSMYLKAGETVTLETLLYGLLLCSGNDAAVAIAEAAEGGQAGFVARMNEKAKALGMAHSSFANPNGLDHEKHYSTARDMGKLACAASKNETLMRIASTRQVTLGGRIMVNHNKLLRYLDGCVGLKTGYTRAAGRTLVSCTVQNGQRLVAVTLKDGNDWADHQALCAYGFSAYPVRDGAAVGEVLGQTAVKGGTVKEVPLAAAERFRWPLTQEEKLDCRLEVPQELQAPLWAGSFVGEAVFSVRGTEVGRVSLIVGEDVPVSPKRP